jgi:Na+-translocating ferredoxin:NAD+ oxidoreductase RnfC subunit
MKQECDAFKNILFSEMSKEEIYALFDRYKFRDQHNHDLLNCLEFTQIVDHVIASRECPVKGEYTMTTEDSEILDS